MSETTDRTSCISHRALVHYFIMYEDFLEVAKVSEHQYKLAAFWRVLETKTNDRITYNEGAKEKGHPVLDLWIEIPYSEFVNRSLGVYKASSFQVAAVESERLGFSKSRVGKRPRNPLDPNSPKDDYKEYLLLTGTLQKTINTGEYPTPIEINSPLLKSISTRKEAKKQKKAIENNRAGIEINSPPVEINTSAIEINRNNNITESSNISKIEVTSDDVAYAPHHDTPTSFFSETSTTKEHTNGNLFGNNHNSAYDVRDNAVQSQLAPLTDRIGVASAQRTGTPSGVGTHPAGDTHGQPADSLTVAMPLSNDAVDAVPPSPSQTNNARGKNDTPSVEPLTALSGISTTASDHHIANDTRTPDDGQKDTTLSRSGENAPDRDRVPSEQSMPPESGATEQPKRGKGKKPAKPATTEEEKQMHKDVQEWINTQRGYKLYGRAPKEQIFAERNAVDALAHMLYLRMLDEQCDECCTWEDLEYTYTYCRETDKYWSRPENRVRIGAYAVLQQFAPAMALKVQQPVISLEDRRNGVHKQAVLGHGTRTQAYGLVPTEELHKSAWEA